MSSHLRRHVSQARAIQTYFEELVETSGFPALLRDLAKAVPLYTGRGDPTMDELLILRSIQLMQERSAETERAQLRPSDLVPSVERASGAAAPPSAMPIHEEVVPVTRRATLEGARDLVRNMKHIRVTNQRHPDATSRPKSARSGRALQPACPVCLDAFDEGDAAVQLVGCGHTFCEECLSHWIAEQQSPDACPCPVCRRDVFS